MSQAATMPRRAGPDRRRDPEGDRDLRGSDDITTARQEVLPPLRWLHLPDGERFAHPIEREFARLLTFYGVRWGYEPTTFAVRWGSEGRPEEFVTPDFYLPEHDLYIELTTMRQRLVTRKNRKFRMLRETYPNVNVRLLYLRDCLRLREVYGLSSQPRAARIGSTLYATDDVETRIAELAQDLASTWHARRDGDRGTRPLLLGLGAGSGRFLAALEERLRGMGVAIETDFAILTTFTPGRGAARARLTKPPGAPIAGRPVVIAQEVLSTGLSAAFLAGWLRRHGAWSVEVCALLDRTAARILDVPVVCRGFAAPDIALAGYGLTRWREYRDLPYIAEIETD